MRLPNINAQNGGGATYLTAGEVVDVSSFSGFTPTNNNIIHFTSAGKEYEYIYVETFDGVAFNGWLPMEFLGRLTGLVTDGSGNKGYMNLGETASTLAGRGWDTSGCSDSPSGIVIEDNDNFIFSFTQTSNIYLYIEASCETGATADMARFVLANGANNIFFSLAYGGVPNALAMVNGTSLIGEHAYAISAFQPLLLAMEGGLGFALQPYGATTQVVQKTNYAGATTDKKFGTFQPLGAKKTTIKRAFIFYQ